MSETQDSILWNVSICEQGANDIHASDFHVVAKSMFEAVIKAQQWLDDTYSVGEPVEIISEIKVIDWIVVL